MAEERDDGRNSPAQNAKTDDKMEAVGATAATGLGCLSLATLPFSVLIFIAILFLIVWIIHRMVTTGHW